MTVCDLTQFYSPHSGGVKRYLQEKREYVRQHQPTSRHILIIPGEADTETKEAHGPIFTIRSPLVNRTSRYRMLLRLSKVEELIETTRPDLIESGDPYQMAWKASATAQALGLASVAFYHSHFAEAYVRSVVKFLGPTINDLVMDFMQRYVRTLYNRFDCTVVPSAPLGQVLASWGVRNLYTTNLGIDPDAFVPDRTAGMAFREQHGIPQEAFLLLFVGRLAPEKNLSTLVEAFLCLSASFPGSYFLLVMGEGSLRHLILRLQESHPNVVWLAGSPSKRLLADAYRAADLFVHPGLQETFGLVTLESQACGTPVVGIRGSYMDRLICTGLASWAEQNDGLSLAEAIHRMRQLNLQEMGREAAKIVRSEYSWQNVFNRLFTLYAQLIDARRSRPHQRF